MTTVYIALSYEELDALYVELVNRPESLALAPILEKILKWKMRPRHEAPAANQPISVPVKARTE